MEEKSFCLDKAATSATATARLRTIEAWPERADEGGGPTPERLRGEQRIEKSHLGRPGLSGLIGSGARLDRIEQRRLPRGVEAEEDADEGGEDDSDDDPMRRNDR